MGADVNCNIGIMLKGFCHTLGPHGINNRNVKGRELLYLYKTNNLKFFYLILGIKIMLHIDRLMTKSRRTCWIVVFAAINFLNKLVTAKLQNWE